MPRISHVKHAQARYGKNADGTRNLSNPKPNLVCDSCREPIATGAPYKHTSRFRGPKMARHEGCPTWHEWEVSDSVSAKCALIQHDADALIDGLTADDDLDSTLNEIAEMIRELAGERSEVASNIEDGFQHPTQQSEEAQEQADALEGWADDVEGLSLDDKPEPEEPAEDEDSDAAETREADDDNAVEEWLDTVKDAMREAVADVPL
jgi:hypothetical protein